MVPEMSFKGHSEGHRQCHPTLDAWTFYQETGKVEHTYFRTK